MPRAGAQRDDTLWDPIRTMHLFPDPKKLPIRASSSAVPVPDLAAGRLTSRSAPCYAMSMTQAITQRELRNDSGAIMRRLDQGETFIVTRNGTPVGELSPLRRHRFVAADAVIAMFRNAPGIDAARFRADLDAVVAQGTDPRA